MYINKNKVADETQEIRNIKTQKFGGLIKRTLEEQLRYLEKLKNKNKDKFEKESNLLRDKINELIRLQEENKKISQDNIEIFEANIETEKKNVSTSSKNKEYLTELYTRVNDL